MKPGGSRERGYEAWVDDLRAENERLRMELDFALSPGRDCEERLAEQSFYVEHLEAEVSRLGGGDDAGHD